LVEWIVALIRLILSQLKVGIEREGGKLTRLEFRLGTTDKASEFFL